jgi:hypothetical protein
MWDVEFTKQSWVASFSILSALVLFGIGCGYQFSGVGEGLPGEVQTVFVAPFANKSRDVGIEHEVTSLLRSELHRGGRLRGVYALDEADAVLTGVIRALDTRVVAVNREDETLQFETNLIFDASLRQRSPDEVLWFTRGSRLVETHSAARGAMVITSSEFKTGTLNPEDVSQFTDVQLSEALRQGARESLMERFAREIHRRIMGLF